MRFLILSLILIFTASVSEASCGLLGRHKERRQGRAMPYCPDGYRYADGTCVPLPSSDVVPPVVPSPVQPYYTVEVRMAESNQSIYWLTSMYAAPPDGMYTTRLNGTLMRYDLKRQPGQWYEYRYKIIPIYADRLPDGKYDMILQTKPNAGKAATLTWFRVDADEVALYSGLWASGGQIGSYRYSDKLYRPLTDGVWGPPMTPPIAPPASPDSVGPIIIGDLPVVEPQGRRRR